MKTLCPHCNGVYDVPDEFKGEIGECALCGKEFLIAEVAVSVTPVEAAPQPAAPAPLPEVNAPKISLEGAPQPGFYKSKLGPSASASLPQLEAIPAGAVNIPKPQHVAHPPPKVGEGGRTVEHIVGNSVPCKECGYNISRFAVVCPKCGVGYHLDRVVTAKLSGPALLAVCGIALLSALIGAIIAKVIIAAGG